MEKIVSLIIICGIAFSGCSQPTKLPSESENLSGTTSETAGSSASETEAPVSETEETTAADTESTDSFTAESTEYEPEDDDFWFDYEDIYGKNAPHSSVSKNSALFSDKLGSCGELENRTVVVSIFVNDTISEWDLDYCYDYEVYNRAWIDLDYACYWISRRAEDYGKKAEFIYDWDIHPDLLYFGDFDIDFSSEIDYDTSDKAAWEYIEKNIDTKALLEEYRAQNILYMLYINSYDDCEAITCTRSNYQGMSYPYEICFFFMNDDGELECPAVFAHEMLHAFGAPDLYTSDGQYGITDEYVKHCEDTQSNDIMFTCYDRYSSMSYYTFISNEVTDITAYYIGWTDHSDDVEKYGLGAGEHKNAS